MPRQRWIRSATRAYADATRRSHAAAAAALSGLESAGRTSRAARVLGVALDDPAALATAACLFAGLAPPGGPLAQAMIQRLAVVTDAVPAGTLATRNDLVDAAQNRADEVWPAIPSSIADVLATLNADIALIEPVLLRTLATELAMDVAMVEVAAVLVPSPRSRHEVPPRWDRDDAEDAELVRSLARLAPDSWGEREVAVLRQAALQHLARIGDALLCAGEWQPRPLTWTQPSADDLARIPTVHRDVVEIAKQFVPGRTTPLQALLHNSQKPATANERDRSPLFPSPAPAPVPDAHGWSIGWPDVHGRHRDHRVGTAPSPAAARHAAEVTVSELLTHPEQVRSLMGRDLLVPRTSTASPSLADAATRLALDDVLFAVSNWGEQEARGGGGASGWPMQPHAIDDSGVDGPSLGSVIAVVLDHVDLPYPPVDHPACRAMVGSAEMSRFLREQGIEFTAATTIYLRGMGTVDDGERPLHARHRAGVQALLAAAAEPGVADELEVFAPFRGHLTDIQHLPAILKAVKADPADES
jgi:hypothetical protein